MLHLGQRLLPLLQRLQRRLRLEATHDVGGIREGERGEGGGACGGEAGEAEGARRGSGAHLAVLQLHGRLLLVHDGREGVALLREGVIGAPQLGDGAGEGARWERV